MHSCPFHLCLNGTFLYFLLIDFFAFCTLTGLWVLLLTYAFQVLTLTSLWVPYSHESYSYSLLFKFLLLLILLRVIRVSLTAMGVPLNSLGSLKPLLYVRLFSFRLPWNGQWWLALVLVLHNNSRSYTQILHNNSRSSRQILLRPSSSLNLNVY